MNREIAVESPPTRTSFGNLFERWAIRLGRRFLDGPIAGSMLLTLPSGRSVRIGEKTGADEAELKLRNYALVTKALRRGSVGFADAYIDGDIDTPDLIAVFRFFLDNEELFEKAGRGFFKVRGMDRAAHLLRHNSLSGSQRNIAEHYDLGNEFFAAWLDPEMNYSSAFYENGARSLEDAQVAKQDVVIDAMEVREGHKVLEIGCGWGSMARRLAALGANVTGITLSKEQLAYAREESQRQGLGDQTEFRLQDYRKVTGQFDRIVSVEMIEAVGRAYWPAYFGAIRDRLKPGGVAAIQAITIEEKRFEAYDRSADFIQRYIFPGGMLLTGRIIAEQAKQAGLSFDGSRCFGQSYALTLAEWRRRFESVWPKLVPLGFDEPFRRMWRYYLAYCEIGFERGMIDVGVYQLRRPLVNT